MAREGQAHRAASARGSIARTLPCCLAILVAGGNVLAEPGAFGLAPAMFALDLQGHADSGSFGQLSLFRGLKFGDVTAPAGGASEEATLFRTEGTGRVTLFLGDFPLDLPPPPAVSVTSAPAARRTGLLRPIATGGIMGLAVGASLRNSMKEPSHAGFRVRVEGFFGANTYTGGADKAAHFVDYTIAWRLMDTAYRGIGYTDSQSRWLAVGTSFVAGLSTEIGDGTTLFGFSFEDLLMDALGATTAMMLSRSGWDDTFGFRYGTDVPQESACCATDNYGRDYSGEIYAADFKIAGLGRRLRFNPGPARFLLVSGTYGSNGYRNAPPELRQRLVGIEIGVHFSEILRSLGVPEKAFWGEILYVFFDSIRLPYTAIGVRYDLNHHQWFGPTASGKTPFPRTGSR